MQLPNACSRAPFYLEIGERPHSVAYCGTTGPHCDLPADVQRQPYYSGADGFEECGHATAEQAIGRMLELHAEIARCMARLTERAAA